MEKKNKVAYIAGSISDRLDAYQYDFCDCEMVLNHLGYVVLSPAWLPIGLHEYDDYMNIGEQMLRASDLVVFLEGWEESVGASIEHDLAMGLHKKIVYYNKNRGCRTQLSRAFGRQMQK